MQFKLLTLSLLSTLSLAAPTVEERTVNSYTLKDFTRDCTDAHACKYNYSIVTSDYTVQCTYTHRTPILNKRTGPLATTEPFASIPCEQDGRWLNSLGWNYPRDFVVITVVHKPNNVGAFFGYDHVNIGPAKKTFADQTNPVVSLNF